MGLFPVNQGSLFIHGRDTDRTGGRAVGGTPTAAGETPALPFLERARATGSLATVLRTVTVTDGLYSDGSCGLLRQGALPTAALR